MNAQLGVAFAVALVIMIVLPVLLVIGVVRTRSVPRAVPLVAVLFYLANLAINIPLTAYVWPLAFGRGSLVTLVLTCLTYGVCEELARYASFRFVRVMRENRDESGALAAGLGHGGAESILFGLQFAAGFVLIFLLGSKYAPATAKQVSEQGPLGVLLTGLDRLPALAGHVAFAFLIVMAFRRGIRYLPIAIVAHTLLDLIVFGLRQYVPGLWYEAVFALLGGLALVFVAQVLKKGTLSPEPIPEGPRPEWTRRGLPRRPESTPEAP